MTDKKIILKDFDVIVSDCDDLESCVLSKISTLINQAKDSKGFNLLYLDKLISSILEYNNNFNSLLASNNLKTLISDVEKIMVIQSDQTNSIIRDLTLEKLLQIDEETENFKKNRIPRKKYQTKKT
jgi:hypothetical protein